MFKAADTTSVNATVNRQLLENCGVPTVQAAILVSAITALDSRYRLEAFDPNQALRLLQAGNTPATVARRLRAL